MNPIKSRFLKSPSYRAVQLAYAFLRETPYRNVEAVTGQDKMDKAPREYARSVLALDVATYVLWLSEEGAIDPKNTSPAWGYRAAEAKALKPSILEWMLLPETPERAEKRLGIYNAYMARKKEVAAAHMAARKLS